MSQGLQFVAEMLHYYQTSPEFHLETYAAHFIDVKATKFHSWKKFTCELCGSMELNGQLEWDKHVQTRKHRNRRRQAAKGQVSSDKEFYAAKNAAVAPVVGFEAQSELQGDIDDIFAFFD